jgi:hypothetical protein
MIPLMYFLRSEILSTYIIEQREMAHPKYGHNVNPGDTIMWRHLVVHILSCCVRKAP